MIFKETYKYINPQDYVETFSNPTWYLDLEEELAELFYNYDGDRTNKSKEWLAYRREFMMMVNELFKADAVALASSGANEDEERKDIDTIVIHHTGRSEDYPISLLDPIGLIRLYASRFSEKNAGQYGRAIWSNHFYKGKQTFVAYHYVIREDGSFENFLSDDQIGWHCGNWDYNCRSIAIAFHDDLLGKEPTEKALETANEIIRKYTGCKILGHREILATTTCPGNLFLGKCGWKNKLKSN